MSPLEAFQGSACLSKREDVIWVLRDYDKIDGLLVLPSIYTKKPFCVFVGWGEEKW